MAALMKKMHMIVRSAAVYRAERVKAEGLLPSHHSYVMAIVRNPGLSQDALAARLCTTKSTVARQLATLEKHGYVERRPSEQDRRVLQVYPTEKMTVLYPAVDETSRAWNKYLFSDLSEEEKQAFDAVLERITARAEAYVGGREEDET